MAIAEDLLEQAHHLVRRERTKPKQASLRPAVSAAYYALFHLLIKEAARNWKRPDQRAALARTFDHNRMRKASQRLANSKLAGESAQAAADLKGVASAFDHLQELRHLADYDDTEKWSRTSALKAVNLVADEFLAWRAVRTERMAQDYLFDLHFARR